MHAVILSIGDELVLGQTVDTNSAFLSAELAQLGIATTYHQTVADNRAAVVAAFRQASACADLVIATGGLGPTEDDLTRDALAEVMGAPLVEDRPSLEAIREFFSRRDRPMPERNRMQAMHPQGSRMIPNPRGTAPGLTARIDHATVYVLPGVPSEMRGMFRDAILPALQAVPGTRPVILTTTIHTFGQGESTVSEVLSDLMARDRNPRVGTTVANGIVPVRVRSEFVNGSQAQDELDHTAGEIERRLGPIVFGRDEQTLPQAVLQAIHSTTMTVATAESCTGGLLGKYLTDVPGASAVYLGGWVTYSNDMKRAQLGVSTELLEAHGAVSKPVACAMAEGALRVCGADLAISITGIAGPEGGDEHKPVGTVWFALANRQGMLAARCVFPGDRATIRDRAARTSLQLLRFHLMNVPWREIGWLHEK